jgi:hypothetical protein
MKQLLFILILLSLCLTLVHSQHTYYVKTRNATSPAFGAKDTSILDYWVSPLNYNGNFTETPLLTVTSGINVTFCLVKNSTDGFIICSIPGCGGNSTNLGNSYPHGLTVNGTCFNLTAPTVSVATALYYGAYSDVYWGNDIYVIPAPSTITSTLIDLLAGANSNTDFTTWETVGAVFIALFSVAALLACCFYRSGHRFIRVPGSS